MLHRIEKLRQVRINSHALPLAKTETCLRKTRIKDQRQHLRNSLLNQAAKHSRYPQRARAPCCLWNIYSFDW